jgi:hypothetical protein
MTSRFLNAAHSQVGNHSLVSNLPMATAVQNAYRKRSRSTYVHVFFGIILVDVVCLSVSSDRDKRIDVGNTGHAIPWALQCLSFGRRMFYSVEGKYTEHTLLDVLLIASHLVE